MSGGDQASLQLRPIDRQMRAAGLRTIAALILREMTTRYGRSPGGYAWMILEPVAGIAMLSIVFSLGFRYPPLGHNFPIFYATGLIPFFMFNTVSTAMAQAINFSRQLLVYPRVTFIDAMVARLVLNVLTQLLIFCLVIAGLLLVFDTRTTLDIPKILLSFSMLIVLAAGIGTLNCFLMLRFVLWQSVWSILTRPLLFVSGVLILPEAVPEPYRGWSMWNPILHPICEMRAAFYHGYDPSYIDPPYVFGIGLVSGAMGLLFLRRYYRDIQEL